MFIKAKNFYLGKKKCSVKLVTDGYFYSVKVDGVEYKKTPNRILPNRYLMRFKIGGAIC